MIKFCKKKYDNKNVENVLKKVNMDIDDGNNRHKKCIQTYR